MPTKQVFFITPSLTTIPPHAEDQTFGQVVLRSQETFPTFWKMMTMTRKETVKQGQPMTTMPTHFSSVNISSTTGFPNLNNYLDKQNCFAPTDYKTGFLLRSVLIYNFHTLFCCNYINAQLLPTYFPQFFPLEYKFLKVLCLCILCLDFVYSFLLFVYLIII